MKPQIKKLIELATHDKEDLFTIKRSKIAGNGVFSKSNINKNYNIGLAFTKINNTGTPDNDYDRTDLGRYVNHSNKANVKLKKQHNKYYYVVIKNIKKDEEILIDYNQFPWEGKRIF